MDKCNLNSLIHLIDKKNVEKKKSIDKLLQKLSAMNQVTSAINSLWCNCDDSEKRLDPPRSFCKTLSSNERPHFSLDTIINDLKLMIIDIDKDEAKCKQDRNLKSQSTHSFRPTSHTSGLLEQPSKEPCAGCSAMRSQCIGIQCHPHKGSSDLAFRETWPTRCRCQCTKYNGLQDSCEGYPCDNKNCVKRPFADEKEGWVFPTIPCERHRDKQVKNYPLLWEYPHKVAETRRCLLKELIENDLLIGKL